MVSKKNNGKNILYVGTRNVPKFIERALHSNQILAINGPPGCGKSAMVKEAFIKYAKKKGYKEECIKLNPTTEDYKDEKNICFNTIVGSQLESVDTKGGLSIDKEIGITRFFNTEIFPTKNWAKAETVFFFDEFGNTRTDVQSALQPLFITREINNVPLVESRIIVATNSIDDNTGVNALNSALCNRMAWIEVGYQPFKDWVELMVDLKIYVHPLIAAYGTVAGEKISTFEADSNRMAYATPRSWLMASDYIRANELNNIKDFSEAVSIFCGVSEAEHFETFAKISMSVDIDAIIKNPEKIKEVNANEPGLLYSVLFNLVDRVKSNQKNLAPVLKAIANNELEEYNILALKMLTHVSNINNIAKEISAIPELKANMISYINIIQGAGNM